MSSRLNQEREKELQPKRMATAKAEIEKRGLKITYIDGTQLAFMFKGQLVRFWPYSGWHTGRTIEDGRGLTHLLNQLKEDDNAAL